MNYYLSLLLLLTFSSLNSMDQNSIYMRNLLFEGAKTGDIAKVREAISNQADINAIDESHVSPLYWAAQGGHDAIVELLISHRAQIDLLNTTGGFHAIHVATSLGHFSTVQLLVRLGANPSSQAQVDLMQPIHWAASRGHLEIAQWLVAQGALPDARSILQGTPLQFAAQYGHQPMVQWLVLEQNADINAANSQGITPLLDALIAGHQEIARWLIEHGANLNVVSNYGSTPLGIAKEQGFTEIYNMILERIDPEGLRSIELTNALVCKDFSPMIFMERGGSVDTCDARGSTMLHHAVVLNLKDHVEFLIRNKADVNIKNRQGATPVHVAALSGHDALLVALLEAGASIYTTVHGSNMSDVNALFLAVSEDRRASLNTLLEWGASVASDAQLVSLAYLGGHWQLAEWLLYRGAQLDNKDKSVFSLTYYARGEHILDAIINDQPQDAIDRLARQYYGDELFDGNELQRAFPLAVAMGHFELVSTIGDNFRTYLSVESVRNALISAATQANSKMFKKVFDIASQVLPLNQLREMLSDLLGWAATTRSDLAFFQEVYQLARQTLTQEGLLSSLEDTLARASVQGGENIVSFILEQVFTTIDGQGEGFDLGRAGRRVTSMMNHEDTPQDLRNVLRRIHDNLALYARMRLVFRRSNAASPLQALNEIIQSLGLPLPANVPLEMIALILQRAFWTTSHRSS